MKIRYISVLTLIATCFVSAAFAQAPDRKAAQAVLKSYFEGKRVVVKIDMPAARAGIDLFPEKPVVMDFSKMSKRIGEYGTSLRAGDRPVVTELELGKDTLEFHLDGGGYGSMSDSSSEPRVPSYPTRSPKSNYEKDLENELKSATDSDRIKTIRRELERERNRRDRDYDRDMRDYNQAKAYRDDFVAQKRLTRGSRFNIKFDKRNTAEITPEELMRLLGEYVDFSIISGGGSGDGFSESGSSGQIADGPPYIGQWRSGRGDSLRIGNGLIQFGTKNQMEFKELFRVASANVYAIELLNPGDMSRYVFMKMGAGNIKLTYYDTLADLQNEVNPRGEETWSK